MLQVQISEHKLGIFIEGDYHDLDMLYKSIDAVIHSGSLQGMMASENYLYSMMYDIRNAMSGNREFDVFQNQLTEEILASLPVKDDTSIYYGFYTLLSDAMFTLLSLHTINHNDVDDMYYYYLRMFIVLVINAYKEEDIDVSGMSEFFNKEASYSLQNYYHQYIELCTLRLLECEEDKRLELAGHFLTDMTEFKEDYESLVDEVVSYAKDNNCHPSEITYIDNLGEFEY